jgi:hypothetical protein
MIDDRFLRARAPGRAAWVGFSWSIRAHTKITRSRAVEFGRINHAKVSDSLTNLSHDASSTRVHTLSIALPMSSALSADKNVCVLDAQVSTIPFSVDFSGIGIIGVVSEVQSSSSWLNQVPHRCLPCRPRISAQQGMAPASRLVVSRSPYQITSIDLTLHRT